MIKSEDIKPGVTLKINTNPDARLLYTIVEIIRRTDQHILVELSSGERIYIWTAQFKYWDVADDPNHNRPFTDKEYEELLI